MSRWEHWSRGSNPPIYFSDYLKEGPVDPVDGGNPSGSGVMSPGDRARSMGLQSDGKGGYIDPKSGQKVAQTVNNELVFYSTAPGGGVTTDGAGGAQTARPSSSWQDPITGLMTVPPGKAETPQEIAAVPDPVPAQVPHGYANFIQQQKQSLYQQDSQQRELNKVLGQQPEQPPQPEMAPDASSSVRGEPAPMPQVEEYTSDKLFDRMKGVPNSFNTLRDRMKSAQPQQQPEPQPQPEAQTQQPQQAGDQQQAPQQEESPEDREADRKQQLIGALQNLVATPEKMRGAGANAMSREDAEAFMKYINEGPQNQRVPLQDGELDYAMSYLKDNYKDRWNSLQSRLKGKGDPEPSRKVVSRAREVLQSYLENLGTSAIDGSPLTFSESELDHRVSLDNGGLDQGDNWDWLPRRFNQFKGALGNEALLAKLQKRLDENPDDEELKEKVQELTRRQRGDWGQYFKDKGWSQLSQGDIQDQNGPLGMQFLKALAEASGTSHYKDRGVTRSSGRAGGGTSLNIDELKERLIDNLGIPSKQDADAFDGDLINILQSLEDQRSEVDSANRKRKAERKAEKKKKVNESLDLYYNEEIDIETLFETFKSEILNDAESESSSFDEQC